MFLKKLRSRSKSSKQSMTRVTTNSSSHETTNKNSKVPGVMVTPPTNDLNERLAKHESSREGEQRNDDEERDYQLFLEQARKNEEKAEKKRIAEIKAARQVNLSPWGGKM